MSTITLSPAEIQPDGRIKLSATLTYGLHSVKQYLIVQAGNIKPEQLAARRRHAPSAAPHA